MSDEAADACGICGRAHCSLPGAACAALNEAAAEGAHPKGVPLRVYGAYLEARAAMRANAPELAITELRWLLSSIAEERGIPKERSLSAKLDKLRNDRVISASLEPLFERALSPAPGTEEAWALMSIVEHALYRLYLKPSLGD